MLRLELTLAPDGSAELHDVAFAEEDLVSVCDTDTTHPSRAGPSWYAGRRVTAACCRASSPSSTSARSLPADGITALPTLCRPPTALPPTDRFEPLPPPPPAFAPARWYHGPTHPLPPAPCPPPDGPLRASSATHRPTALPRHGPSP